VATSGAAAGAATTDVVLNSTATRTAGLLLDVQNSTVSRFRVGPAGVVATSGAAAGAATTDVVLNSTATRTAGLLLDVQNSTVSRFSVGPTGILTGGGAVLSPSLAAASASTDFDFNTVNTRTAGLLLDIRNNTASKFSVGPTGIVTAAITADGTASISWGTNWGAGADGASVRKSCGLVTVSLQATATGAGDFAPVLTLPAGYRPTHLTYFMSLFYDQSSGNIHTSYGSVATNGQITISGYDYTTEHSPMPASTLNDWVEFSVTFNAM